MSMNFTKLFASITDSSIWSEDSDTKVVWVTMLAMADQFGRIHAAIPGLAKRANVSIQATESALNKFSSPDPYSRTSDHEGRRIECIDGGWHLLNYDHYRMIRSDEDRKEQVRLAQARFRDKKRNQLVIKNKQNKPIGDADADADADKKKRRSAKALTDEAFWNEISEKNPEVDLKRERQKMETWLLTRPGRKLTRQFVVNWINKADRTMSVSSSNGHAPQATTIFGLDSVIAESQKQKQRIQDAESSWEWDGGIKRGMKPECLEAIRKLNLKIEESRKLKTGLV